jgi:hypothetical protein
LANRSASSIIKILPIKNHLLSIARNSGEKVVLKYFNYDGQEFWQYSPNEKYAINENYIYQDNVYLILNSLKKIVEKVNINEAGPNQEQSKKLNFFYEAIKNHQTPFLELQEKPLFNWQLREKYLQVKYLISHLRQLFIFEKNEQVANKVLEINISHDENLYRNKFTDLKIEATFKQTGQTEVLVLKVFITITIFGKYVLALQNQATMITKSKSKLLI